MLHLRMLTARRALPVLRSNRLVTGSTLRNHSRTFLWNGTKPVDKTVAGKKTVYPERMLVYHGGTGRTVFVGCLKITTIFIFSFFTTVVTPALFVDETQPIWVPLLAEISGTVPLLFVAYVSAPFVTYIHLRIPPFARNSKELLLRFAKTLPEDAELDITTMSFLGKPRATRMKLQELHAVHERFGMVNFSRDAKTINAKRPWWRKKAVSQFGVHGKKSGSLDGQIWELMKENIMKRKSR